MPARHRHSKLERTRKIGKTSNDKETFFNPYVPVLTSLDFADIAQTPKLIALVTSDETDAF